VYGELAKLVETGAIGAAVEAMYPLRQYRQALQHATEERPRR